MQNNHYISPSALALKGFDLDLIAEDTATEDFNCAVCAVHIKEGEGINLWRDFTGPSFTNNLDFANISEKRCCKHCATVLTHVMFATHYTNGVLNHKGYRRVMSNEERAWFFQNVPETPFVLTITTQAQGGQHLVWRAKVTTDKDHIFILEGDDTKYIYMPKVRNAARVIKDILHPLLQQKALEADLESEDPKAKKKKPKKPKELPLKTPYFFSGKAGSGIIKSQYLEIINSGQMYPEDRKALLILNPAEAWAVTYLLMDNAKEPKLINTYGEKPLSKAQQLKAQAAN